MSVLVVVASRNRAGSLNRMLASVARTSKAEVAIYADEDQRDFYAAFATHRLTVGPRIGPVASLNALVRNNPGFDVYAAATDDCEFETPGWDDWLLEQKFPGGIGAMAPYVEGSPGALDFPAVTSRWIEAIGHLGHPGFRHFYWDLAIQVAAEHCGCCRRAEAHEFSVRHHGIAPEVDSMRVYFDAKSLAIWCLSHRCEEVEKIKRTQA